MLISKASKMHLLYYKNKSNINSLIFNYILKITAKQIKIIVKYSVEKTNYQSDILTSSRSISK